MGRVVNHRSLKPYLLLSALLILTIGCQSGQSEEIELIKIVLDNNDSMYGYYYIVEPKDEIKSALLLMPGFGQKSEDIFLDTELHREAYKHNILTIGYAGGGRLTADSLLQSKITSVLEDILSKYTSLRNDKFVIGGFSAGGTISLRYAELCNQFPEQYPITPRGVFMADSPVDLYHSWKLLEENMKNSHSEISVNEAKMVQRFYKHYYGATPTEDPETYKNLSPFSIEKEYGTNEVHLKNTAVRSYHDIDIMWRLKNRNQTARFDNFISSSELINRLMLMGNSQAEFIQTHRTGYRRNGDRHPHSWSIIDATECVKWINGLMEKSKN